VAVLLHPIFRGIVLDANEKDAGVLGSGGFGEFAEVVCGALVVIRIVDENYAARSMHLGVDGLFGKRNVFLMRIFLGLVAEDQDEFSGNVEAGVIIVIRFLVGNSEAGEDDGRVKLA